MTFNREFTDADISGVETLLLMSGGAASGSIHNAFIQHFGSIGMSGVLPGGISIGAAGALCLATEQHFTYEKLFSALNDAMVADGIDEYMPLALAPAQATIWQRIQAAWKMLRGISQDDAAVSGWTRLQGPDSMSEVLDREFGPGSIKHPFFVGLVLSEVDGYRDVLIGPDTPWETARDLVLASCAMAMVHQYVEIEMEGRVWTARDGGHRSVLPIPDLDLFPSLTGLHASFTAPIGELETPRPSDSVRGFADSAKWAFAMMFSAARYGDHDALCRIASERPDLDVTVTVPKDRHGGFLDATAEAGQARLKESFRAFAARSRPVIG